MARTTPTDRGRPAPTPGIEALIRRALVEDRAGADVTTRALRVPSRPVTARVVAQAPGTLSGMEALRVIARRSRLTVLGALPDGARVRRGSVVARLRGDPRRILSVERTLLNFLMHASGVATATHRAVDGARGARRPLTVLATRKTLPGLRDLEKAAVVHGGGRPHRRDLSAAVLIKNNHLALLPAVEALRRARARAGGRAVEVEVRTVAQALGAARAGADRILIDNAGPRRATAIVRALERAGLREGRSIELSGGVGPDDVAAYRRVGADAVSLGALTHSARALPFHLRIEPARLRRSRP